MGKFEFGRGMRVVCACEPIAHKSTVAVTNARYAFDLIAGLSCTRSSMLHGDSDLVDGAVRGKRRAFLPADDVAGVIAGKVDAAVRKNDAFIGLRVLAA